MQISTTIIIVCLSISVILFAILYHLVRQEIRYHKINMQVDELLTESARLSGYAASGKEINIENINKILKFRLMWDDTRKTFVKVTEISEEDLV